jgi:hypothetical protein
MSKSLAIGLILSGVILVASSIMDGLQSRNKVKQLEVTLITYQTENKKLKEKINEMSPYISLDLTIDKMVSESIDDMKNHKVLGRKNNDSTEKKFSDLDKDIKAAQNLK